MAKLIRRYRFFILTILCLPLLIGGFLVIEYYIALYIPNIETDNEKGESFYIHANDTPEDVLNNLKKSKAVLNASTLVSAAKKLDFKRKIYRGHYLLSSGMNNKELLRRMMTNQQSPIDLVIRQVRTSEQLAAHIAQQVDIDSVTLLSTFQNSEFLQKYLLNPETVISFFLENSYQFYWTVDIETLFKRFAKEWESFWSKQLDKKREELGLSRIEVITLASIVSEETSKIDEMPIIAGVYINRLKRGMKLQADPTVLFVTKTHHLGRVYHKHLKVDSPYNTYIYAGLPPGPISLPPRSAILAVLNYTKHKYIYFCARPELDGYHAFASNLIEHERNASAYRKRIQQQ